MIRSRGWVAAPVAEVFAFFDDPGNLARLMPPPVTIQLVRVDPAPPQPGSIFEFRYAIGPFGRSWVVRLVDRVPNERFVDETVSGPMRRFDHVHAFAPASSGGTWVEDRIEYHVGPGGSLGAVVDFAAGVVMRLTFVWRHAMQRRILRGG